ncbi:MAG: TonB-dependent receptor [Chitinispirillaceae bacterium]|nr:TonB-dependent receptor [Chitinispirillaceae bacterium]
MRLIAPLLIGACAFGARAFQLPADKTVYRWPDSLRQPVAHDGRILKRFDSAADARETYRNDRSCIPATVPSLLMDPPDSNASAAGPRHAAATATGPAEPDSAVYELPRMVVYAPVAQPSERQYVQSSVRFTADDMKRKAGTVEDVSRYIGTLPSVVSSIGEGYDNTLFIRGGRPSEVIFCVDGIEMENINHFSKANGCGGPISFISSENVKEVTCHAGAMPVSAPPRLSSVIDIRTNNGPLYRTRGTVGCKLTGGMFSFEGPLKAGGSSYGLSGRYADFSALSFYVEGTGIPKVGDLFGKVFSLVNDAVDIAVTGLLSWSSYAFSYPMVMADDRKGMFENRINEHESVLQGGAGVTLRSLHNDHVHEARLAVSFRDGLQHDSLDDLSDAFFLNRYAANPVRMERDQRIRAQFNTESKLRLADRHSLLFGVRVGANRYVFHQRDQSRYEGECIVCREDKPDTVPVKKDPMEKQTVLYGVEPGAFLAVASAWHLISTEIGMRADYYDLLGCSALSPRFSCTVRPPSVGAFSAHCGLYHQFPVEMPSLLFACLPQNSPADSLRSLERALLSQVEPQRCWQASIGYDKFLWRQNEVRIETWYKWYDREYDFIAPEAQDILFLDETGALRLRNQDGRRRAYGLEASIRCREAQRFFYALGASLFDVKNRYRDAAWRNDWTNVRYTYALSAGAQLWGGHQVSLSLQGTGGRPFCPERIALDCIGRKTAIYDNTVPYFSRRLDRLVAANARYCFSGRISRLRAELFMELLNALDYTPTLEYKWNGERFIEVKPFKITPIAGCTFNW